MKLRTFLIIMIVLMMIALFGMVGYRFFIGTGDPPKSKIVEKIPTDIKPPPVQVVPELVKRVNERNAKIASLSCEEADVRIWQGGGMRVRLDAKVFYQKPNNFRMLISSVLGKEVDIGSNDQIFWYWSRRSRPQALFWAKYEDFHSTRLKTPFNPVFLRESFGVDVIDIKKSKFAENEKGILALSESKNSMGKPIRKYIFVNKKSELIDGFLVSYEDGTKSASSEVLEYGENNLPKKILFTYYEENKVVYIELDNIKANIALSDNLWVKPNIAPQVDLSEKASSALLQHLE